MGTKINDMVYKLTLTYLKKNADYGNSVDKTRLALGDNTDLVRMADKISRLNQLLCKGDAPEVTESVEDTLLDLVVYMAIYYSRRGTLEGCSSPGRLCDIICNLDSILSESDVAFDELQKLLGREILSDKLKEDMVVMLQEIVCK